MTKRNFLSGIIIISYNNSHFSFSHAAGIKIVLIYGHQNAMKSGDMFTFVVQAFLTDNQVNIYGVKKQDLVSDICLQNIVYARLPGAIQSTKTFH